MLTPEDWHQVYVSMYWSVAEFDEDGRPGVFSDAFRLTKLGLHRVAACGDSITTGVWWDNGYLDLLQDRLNTIRNDASTVNMAVGGTKSRYGYENMEDIILNSCPQIILILYGALDVVDPANCNPKWDCRLIEHLEGMISIPRSMGVTPILSTLLPVNPAGEMAIAQGTVDDYNAEIHAMTQFIDAPLADLNAKFWEYEGYMPDLYGDWGHPSYEGYVLMADGFFEGIETYAEF